MTAGLGAPGTKGQPWVSAPGFKELPPSSRAGLRPSGCRRAGHAELHTGWGVGLVFNKTERCCDLCTLLSEGSWREGEPLSKSSPIGARTPSGLGWEGCRQCLHHLFSRHPLWFSQPPRDRTELETSGLLETPLRGSHIYCSQAPRLATEIKVAV